MYAKRKGMTISHTNTVQQIQCVKGPVIGKNMKPDTRVDNLRATNAALRYRRNARQDAGELAHHAETCIGYNREYKSTKLGYIVKHIEKAQV